MAHDVVICYEYEEKSFADAACSFLEGRNIRCWYAARDVSDVLSADQAAADAIKTAKIMVVVFSDASNDSAQMLRQIELAADHDLTVIPVKLTGTEPTGTMSFYLKPLHWLDALGKSREEAIRQLGDRCAEKLGRAAETAEVRPAPVMQEIPETPETIPTKGELLLKSYRWSWLIYTIIMCFFDIFWLLMIIPFIKEIRDGYAQVGKDDYIVLAAMIVCAAGVAVMITDRMKRAGNKESFAVYAVRNRKEKCIGAVFLFSSIVIVMLGVTLNGFLYTNDISEKRLIFELLIIVILMYLIIRNALDLKECNKMLKEQER